LENTSPKAAALLKSYRKKTTLVVLLHDSRIRKHQTICFCRGNTRYFHRHANDKMMDFYKIFLSYYCVAIFMKLQALPSHVLKVFQIQKLIDKFAYFVFFKGKLGIIFNMLSREWISYITFNLLSIKFKNEFIFN
jgi:hypothetical protein